MSKVELNLRKRALDKIATKIALFYMTETYRDEDEARKLLDAAVGNLTAAGELLVKSDEAATGATPTA